MDIDKNRIKSYNIIFNFGIFFTKMPQYSNYTLYSNYYVLARRGKFLVINPYALGDFCSRIATMFKYFEVNREKCII